MGSQVMARIIQPTLVRGGNGLLVGPDMSRGQCIGSGALFLRRSRRQESAQPAISLHDDRANRLHACPDNRRAAGERRV